MRQKLLTLIIFTTAFTKVFSQPDSLSIYKNLEVKKFYSVGLSSETGMGKGTYKVNGKEVSKAKYNKYASTWENMETCCPCILKSYDENDVLVREAVSCTDCGVGYFKNFYPNGKIKLHGRYKENPTGNWEDIWDRGYCSVPDGQWTCFNEKGDTLYSEYWENGVFVKQVPEQDTNEIWKVELTLNGKPVTQKTLSPEEVKQLVVKPMYKNSAPVETKITLEFQVTAIGYKQNKKTFTPESFKTIDVMQMLSEAGIPKRSEKTFTLMVYNNNRLIASFYPVIK